MGNNKREQIKEQKKLDWMKKEFIKESKKMIVMIIQQEQKVKKGN